MLATLTILWLAVLSVAVVGLLLGSFLGLARASLWRRAKTSLGFAGLAVLPGVPLMLSRAFQPGHWDETVISEGFESLIAGLGFPFGFLSLLGSVHHLPRGAKAPVWLATLLASIAWLVASGVAVIVIISV